MSSTSGSTQNALTRTTLIKRSKIRHSQLHCVIKVSLGNSSRAKRASAQERVDDMSNNAYTSGSDVSNTPFAGITLPSADEQPKQRAKSNKPRRQKAAGALGQRQLREVARQNAASARATAAAPVESVPVPSPTPASARPTTPAASHRVSITERRAYVESLDRGQEFPEAQVVKIVEKGLIIELANGAAQTAFLPKDRLGATRLAEIEDDLHHTGTAAIGVEISKVNSGGGTRPDGKPAFPSIGLRLNRVEREAQQRELLSAYEPDAQFIATPRELLTNDRGVFGLVLEENGVRALLHISQVGEDELRRLMAAKAPVELRVLEVVAEKRRLSVTTETVYAARQNVMGKVGTGEILNASIIKDRRSNKPVRIGDAVRVELAGSEYTVPLEGRPLSDIQHRLRVVLCQGKAGEISLKRAPGQSNPGRK